MTHGFIPVPNVASVELIYTYGGIVCENVFNVQKGSNYSASDLVALRGVVDTWDNSSWKTYRTSGCLLARIRTRARNAADAPYEDYALPTPRAGTTTGGVALPANVTYCVKLATGNAGRSMRGRLYTPGLNSQFIGTTPQEASGTYSNNVVASLNALKTALATAGHTLGVVSYYSGGWRSEGVFTAATGWVAVDLHLDSQRRRLAGRGI